MSYGFFEKQEQHDKACDYCEGVYSEMFLGDICTASDYILEYGYSLDEISEEVGKAVAEGDKVAFLVNYKGEDEGGMVLASDYSTLREFQGKYH